MKTGVTVTDRRALRHAETKAQLLDMAWELARERGLAGLQLNELAERVGMRAPSLYSYFRSKHDIYDAMFAQGNEQFVAFIKGGLGALPSDPQERFRTGVRMAFDFFTTDPVRYQLLSQRTIPGFEPSPESYANALEALRLFREEIVPPGVLIDSSDEDLMTAVAVGLVDQQVANDPGGQRWAVLVDEAADMVYRHLMTKHRERRRSGNPTRGNRGGTR